MPARTVLPQKGRRSDDILAELREMKHDDVDWRHGRAPLFVFRLDEPTYEIGRSGFFEYFSENTLGAGRAFPSVKRMETEVVEMALGLFHAPDDARGFMTSGGSESIIQAIQTCRDWTRAERKAPRLRGNIVGSETLHPAFNKGARLMDLEVRRAPVGPDFRMDLAAIEALIDDDTIMIVGSAPNFAYGIIDPIAELGRVAERKRVWLHVDACVGGYLAPFARMNGRPIPDFDFATPAVCFDLGRSAQVRLRPEAGLDGVLSLFRPRPASYVRRRRLAERPFHHRDDHGNPARRRRRRRLGDAPASRGGGLQERRGGSARRGGFLHRRHEGDRPRTRRQARSQHRLVHVQRTRRLSRRRGDGGARLASRACCRNPRRCTA